MVNEDRCSVKEFITLWSHPPAGCFMGSVMTEGGGHMEVGQRKKQEDSIGPGEKCEQFVVPAVGVFSELSAALRRLRGPRESGLRLVPCGNCSPSSTSSLGTK